MNKKLLIILVLIIGCLLGIITLAFLGLPFPSRNPDGFEKAIFKDSRISEPEVGVLPGIDLGTFGDLLLGPLGIIAAFVLMIGILYLIRKATIFKGYFKYIAFGIFAAFLIGLVIIPYVMVTYNDRWQNSISMDQDNNLTFSMKSISLDGKKYMIKSSNGTNKFSLDIIFGVLTHSFEFSTESTEIDYTVSTTYYTANGPSYTISASKNETVLNIELTPIEGQTYSLEIIGGEATFTTEIVSSGMTFSLSQSNSEIGYSIGINFK